jgi:hypothetical protein
MKIPGVVLEVILSQLPLERFLDKQNDPAPQKRSRAGTTRFYCGVKFS